jgi:hypothetical protein
MYSIGIPTTSVRRLWHLAITAFAYLTLQSLKETYKGVTFWYDVVSDMHRYSR